MRHLKKAGAFLTFLAVLAVFLSFGKKVTLTDAALWFAFPNLRQEFVSRVPLPVTSKTAAKTEQGIFGELPADDAQLRAQIGEENRLSFETLLEEEETSRLEEPEVPVAAAYTKEQLNDYDFLISHIYNVDSSTQTNAGQLDAQKLLAHDFHVNKETEGAQILIYHTHSQEAFRDSIPGDESTTIVGMGSYLTKLLQEQGFQVIHHKGVYDMQDGKLDRNKAYTRAEPEIAKIIRENPDLQLVIDLHRDGVSEKVHLVCDAGGKPTAQVMFFNGLSYSAKNGPVTYLPNPYIEENLALTLQMKLASDSLQPGFARKIYLKSLRFNLHLHPAAMLIEAGAQTNTVAEMRSAMEVLARVICDVL